MLGRPDVLPSLSQVPIVPLSSQIRGLSWEVQLGPEDGLPTACVLKPEWIRIVERRYLGPLIAQLREERLPAVRLAVLDALGLG